MKKTAALSACSLLALAGAAVPAAPQVAPSYACAFSTYFGGTGFEQVRDIAVDGSGNVYITGGTGSANYPTTAGAHDRTHNGWFDVFVTKFSPTGQVVWSTLLGGPNYDRAYGIEVDALGYVYVSGRAGPGFPTTAGVLQPTYQGHYTGSAYGDQNAFVTKIRPDGSGLVWSTYFGTAGMNRDFDLHRTTGEIVVASTYEPSAGQSPFPSAWFTGSFQSAPRGSGDNVVAKIAADGSRVVWATYVGGSGNESGKNSLRLDSTGHVLLLTNTNSTNMPVPNGYQTTFKGVQDFYLAKITPDGRGLVFGTYFGGSDSDWCETHHLGVDGSNNVYISGITHSPDLPTTAGAYQRTFGGINGRTYFHATGDGYVAKFSPTGQLLASTFLGGRYGDGAQGLGVDAQGNVYFTGGTVSDDLPVTPGAYQTAFRGVEDFMAVKLSADLTQLLYCTYLGSTVYDEGRTAWADAGGNFYIGGETAGSNWPVLNAAQGAFGGGTGDNIIVKFAPAAGAPGALRFSASSYSVGEGAGQATITVSRVNGTSGAVTVNYATSNGTAAAGSDYTARSGTLSWASGDSSSKTFTVPVTDDTAVESNETVNLTLSAPTGGAALGSPSAAVLTITDNDSVNPPAPPGGVAAMAGDGRVTLAWSPSAGATSYTVYSRTSAGVTRLNGTPHPGATSPFVLSGLSNGTALYFVVTASNSGGQSAESAEVSATPSSSGWPVADADGDGFSDAAEQAAGSDPADPASRPADTDGDGLGDAWESANFGGLSQDGSGDPDGDGANNLLEYAAGTDPNRADTDGDGLSDLQEIQGGTDPRTAAGGGSSSSDDDSRCGALGIEALLLVALRFRRRRYGK
jgi:hypothetical protein